MNKFLGAILIFIDHYVGEAVRKVITDSIVEAATHGEWAKGEKTQFVIDRARAAAKATATVYDDLLLEIAIKLYVRKFKTEGVI